MPEMQSAASRFEWPIAPEILLPLAANVGGAIVLILLVYLGYRVLRQAARALERRDRVSGQTAFVLQRVLRWTAVVIATVVVLQWFGLLKDFWTFLSAVLALVAIGFVAVWSVLSNVMCSVILMLTRPFRVGDTVELPAQALGGRLVNFTLVFTILRDEEGNLIQIPNNTFFQTPFRCRPGKLSMSLQEQLEKTENTE